MDQEIGVKVWKVVDSELGGCSRLVGRRFELRWGFLLDVQLQAYPGRLWRWYGEFAIGCRVVGHNCSTYLWKWEMADSGSLRYVASAVPKVREKGEWLDSAG